MRKPQLFRANDALTPYTYPIIKAVGCVLLIVVVLVCRFTIHFDNKVVDFIFGLGSVILLLALIFVEYISWAELIFVKDNRDRDNGLHFLLT